MRYGVHAIISDRSIAVSELTRAVEERGPDSLWLPEHTPTPVSRKTPYAMGGEQPEEYNRCLDQLWAADEAS